MRAGQAPPLQADLHLDSRFRGNDECFLISPQELCTKRKFIKYHSNTMTTSQTLTALITGASSGIGKALAIELAKRHINVVITARRENLLTELAQTLQRDYGVTVTVIACDLTAKDSAKQLTEQIAAKNIAIDMLVNNAGFGDHGYFADTKIDKSRDMVQLNITALMELCHHFLPGMVARKRGYILNVASTAGMQPTPLLSVYGATKAFVLSFSQALSAEYKDKNIHITALCPGPVHTEFAERANMQNANLFNAPVMQILSPAAVAQAGIKAVFAGKTICVAGWRNGLMMILSQFSPRSMNLAITKRFMESRL